MTSRTAARLLPRTAQLHADEPSFDVNLSLDLSRGDLVQAMIDMLSLENPGSTAEALRTLRLAYPDCPLALRLAALVAATKVPPRDPNGIYLHD